MPEKWIDEMEIDPTCSPIYLTVGERYMLFALAEQWDVPERTAVKMSIEQAYSKLGVMRRDDGRGTD